MRQEKNKEVKIKSKKAQEIINRKSVLLSNGSRIITVNTAYKAIAQVEKDYEERMAKLVEFLEECK